VDWGNPKLTTFCFFLPYGLPRSSTMNPALAFGFTSTASSSLIASKTLTQNLPGQRG
jgi:hypothetical protein